MKTAGIIGGMSWESTQMYYKRLNEGIKERLGEHNSCPCLIRSINFQPLVQAMVRNDWEQATSILTDAARSLEAGGADFFAMASNTVHQVAEEVKNSVSIPFISITEEVSRYLAENGIRKAGLLGTQYIADSGIYRAALEKLNIELVAGEKREEKIIHNIIFDELVKGTVSRHSAQKAVSIIENLKHKGADAIILGCTELPMLLNDADSSLPLADTTKIHVNAILKAAFISIDFSK